MEVFIGTISTFGFQFAPRDWALCAGQLQSIAQNNAMYALLGTTFGGDGQVTFALPDLRSRVMVNQGQGPGLSNYVMGEMTGIENTTLFSFNLPQHGHALNVTTTAATDTTPLAGQQIGAPSGEDSNLGAVTVKIYGPTPANNVIGATTVGIAGGSQPTPIIQPLLAVNTSIALYGIFPSRN